MMSVGRRGGCRAHALLSRYPCRASATGRICRNPVPSDHPDRDQPDRDQP